MSLSTNTTYRVLVEKLGAADPTQFIGNEGEVFYNPSNPELFLSDGTTPGGLLIGESQNYVGLGLTLDQTIPNTIDTLINLSVISDPNNWYDGTSVTPTISGTYYVSGMVGWRTGTVIDEQTSIQLLKNEVPFGVSIVGVQTMIPYTQNVCGIVTINGTTDFIQFTAFTGNPAGQDIIGNEDTSSWTKLEIFKIGS